MREHSKSERERGCQKNRNSAFIRSIPIQIRSLFEMNILLNGMHINNTKLYPKYNLMIVYVKFYGVQCSMRYSLFAYCCARVVVVSGGGGGMLRVIIIVVCRRSDQHSSERISCFDCVPFGRFYVFFGIKQNKIYCIFKCKYFNSIRA